MALVADAGHNLSDVLALMLAWGASVAAKRPPSPRFTYGYKSSTILAALANAMYQGTGERKYQQPFLKQGEVLG